MVPLFRTKGAVIGIALAILAAGCNTGASPTSEVSSGAPPAAASGSPIAGDGPTTLTVDSFKGVPGGQEAGLPEINQLFSDAHPEIKLEFNPMAPGTAYESKIQTELLAGTGADVVMAQGTQLTQQAKNGYFVDLSTQPWASDVLDGIKPFVSYDGKLYAIPLLASGINLYANMDLLASVGVTTVPTDWPTFLDVLGKLKAAGHTPLSIPDKQGWGGAMTFLMMGATLVPSSWNDDFWNGTVKDFDAWMPVLNQMVELEAKGFIDWKNELGIDEFSQGLPNFQQGTTGFWVQGQWNLPDLNKQGMNVKLIAFPAGPAGSQPNVFVYTGLGWAVNNASKVQSAALEYVSFFAQPEISLKYLTGDGGLSPFKGQESPALKGMEDFHPVYSAGRYYFMPTQTWFGGDVQGTLGAQLQAMLLGQETPEETANALVGLALTKQ